MIDLDDMIAEARRLENDYGDSYEVMLHMSELADALEASEALVKELEAQVKDFKCEQVFRISELQELVEAQARIAELEAKLAARQPSENDYEALRIAVGRVVRDVMNFPQAVQARLLGQDMSPLRDALVDSVVEAGFSRAAVPDAAPSEDDREATEAEIDKAARVLHMAKCCSLSGDSPHDFPEASEVFAAGVVLNAVPRAAVTDAATEELANAKAGWDSALRIVNESNDIIKKLGAERDAALAAIERVRETLTLHNPNGRLVKEVLAALDGAPEPEWEYARQNRYGSVCEPDDSREQAEYRASLGGGYDTVVRRPLVWWEPLPVEGEEP